MERGKREDPGKHSEHLQDSWRLSSSAVATFLGTDQMIACKLFVAIMRWDNPVWNLFFFNFSSKIKMYTFV
jgi:hypothetical protein